MKLRGAIGAAGLIIGTMIGVVMIPAPASAFHHTGSTSTFPTVPTSVTLPPPVVSLTAAEVSPGVVGISMSGAGGAWSIEIGYPYLSAVRLALAPAGCAEVTHISGTPPHMAATYSTICTGSAPSWAGSLTFTSSMAGGWVRFNSPGYQTVQLSL